MSFRIYNPKRLNISICNAKIFTAVGNSMLLFCFITVYNNSSPLFLENYILCIFKSRQSLSNQTAGHCFL